MKLRVLFDDNTIKEFRGVEKVCNLSTKSENDSLTYRLFSDPIYKYNHIEGKIVCFEVIDEHIPRCYIQF